jgi:hypothetical protein
LNNQAFQVINSSQVFAVLDEISHMDIVSGVGSPPVCYGQLPFKLHKLFFGPDSAIEGSCLVSGPPCETCTCLPCKNGPITSSRCILGGSCELLCPGAIRM